MRLNQIPLDAVLPRCSERFQVVHAFKQHKPVLVSTEPNWRRLTDLDDAFRNLLDLAGSSVFLRFTGT